MSMHMIRGVQVHGKSKVKKKPGWRQREEEHRQWLIKMGIDPDKKPAKKEFKEYAPTEPYVRNTEKHSSLETSNAIPGNGAKKESQVYSGDYIVGIATMHKSNLVPVGRGDNPEDYATMRRN